MFIEARADSEEEEPLDFYGRRPSPTGSDFLHFLLICAGVCMTVFATLHLPQRAARATYESHRDRLLAQTDHARREHAEYRRCRDALERDPHYRRIVLIGATGHRPAGVLTVEEFIRQSRAQHDGKTAVRRGAKPLP